MRAKTVRIEPASASVFVDLGFRNAEDRKVRVRLAMLVNEAIASRRMTQSQASSLFGISQPHISELANYKLNRFSAERLIRFISLLDRDVDIVIRNSPNGRRKGIVSVVVE